MTGTSFTKDELVLAFVQFPHPGKEHHPTKKIGIEKFIEWNSGEHKRKFMKITGKHVIGSILSNNQELVCWGEWEPPSRVIKENVNPKTGAKYLYEPLLCVKKGNQNTDPYIFGEHFKYAFCRQPSNKKLKSLKEGSVILFGSTKTGEFVLDTFFVVGARIKYKIEKGKCVIDNNDNEISDIYKKVTLDLLAKSKCGKKSISGEYVLYISKSINDGEPFSFVPCKKYSNSEDFWFDRPIIDIKIIKPKSFRAAIVTISNQKELKNIFDEISSLLISKGYLLGTRFEEPKWK